MAKEQYSIIDIPAKGLTQREAAAIVEKENNVEVVASRLEQKEDNNGSLVVWAHVTKHAFPGDVALPATVDEVVPPDAPEDDPFSEEDGSDDDKGDLASQVQDAIATLQQVADQLGGGDEEEPESDDSEDDSSFFDGGDNGDDSEGGKPPFLSHARLPKTAGMSYEDAKKSASELPSQDPEFRGYRLASFAETERHYLATFKRK